MVLGENVRAARERRHLTQTQVAAMIRVRRRRTTPSYISRIESGRIDPRASTLRSLARALHVPVWYFFWEPSDGIPFVDAYLALPPASKRRVRDLVRYLGHERPPAGG